MSYLTDDGFEEHLQYCLGLARVAAQQGNEIIAAETAAGHIVDGNFVNVAPSLWESLQNLAQAIEDHTCEVEVYAVGYPARDDRSREIPEDPECRQFLDAIRPIAPVEIGEMQD